ncbi:uncharacterized protein LOC107639328 isoform X1 [Arachis ipaensis]|uniref:uncharacterized protein LOC107639328 isoform X1 n=1 Tax=Arachis ipaensis TaxID=130454 RepID=UPI000A2B946C|nr:uncharacterized protein LOC107639328 isoform X1 [Arachis ipaensis]
MRDSAAVNGSRSARWFWSFFRSHRNYMSHKRLRPECRVQNSWEVFCCVIESNKIQATVKKQLINRFKESIIEGQTYRMSYFSVVPNQGNYRAAEHEFKLVFLNRTTIIPVPVDDIPKTCFSFCPFDELLKMTEDYVYLVG